MFPQRAGRDLDNEKEERPAAWAAFLMEPRVLEKKDESPLPHGEADLQGYPVCDLLFMPIIFQALSLGNYFYFVCLIV